MRQLQTQRLSVVLLLMIVAVPAAGEMPRPRARELGVPFDGEPGPGNAITDVGGVEVGHATVISGSGELVVGEGPIRTGVTAILPRGKTGTSPVFAAWFSLNGYGEMTGTTWVEDSGLLGGPIMITTTYGVGMAHHALIQWGVAHRRADGSLPLALDLPVVAETWDGWLNDEYGLHVRPEHVFAALDGATAGAVQEGNVGGGTGMICHEFKGGIGTASRVVRVDSHLYTVGVLVQCNYGLRRQLRIAGVPVGQEITELMPTEGSAGVPDDPSVEDRENGGQVTEKGSIIIVVATDAPLLPHQLKRLVRRASLGLARNGSIAANTSGDIFIAFSTANPSAGQKSGLIEALMLPNDSLSPLFEAVVQGTEEAVVNALLAAETMTGINRRTVFALPHARLREVLSKYHRLLSTP